VWDAGGGDRPNAGIGVDDGRITFERPAGARAFDMTGRTILPGLCDMHVHSFGGTFDGEMMIAAGVTTARDAGSWLSGVLRHRDEAEAGGRLGPRLFVTGPYLVGGGALTDQEIQAGGPEGAAGVVETLADAGVDGIKVHRGIDAATLHRVVESAHERGIWVAAHLDGVTAVEAARAGVDTIEHASGLPDAQMATGPGDDAIIETLIAAGTALVPTLAVAENSFLILEKAHGDAPEFAAIPWLYRRLWIRGQIDNARAARLTGAEIDRRKRQFERLLDFTHRFHRAGGRILAGSDAPAFLVPPGGGLHRELELLVAAGLSPHAALTAATADAARALGQKTLGTLSPGARADLIVVEGSPFDVGGISAVRRTVMVVKDGRILRDRLH